MRTLAVSLALALWGCGGSDGSSPAVDPELRAQVERSTGWTFKTDPLFERIDRQGLARKLEAKLQGEAGKRTAAAGRALQALGLLPRSYDLAAGLKKAYAEEILALYDLKERKIYLVKEALDKPPSPLDVKLKNAGRRDTREATIAHEMIHALQHQHDPLFNLLVEESPDFDDVRGALHALAEGEATIHMAAMMGPMHFDQIARSIEDDGSKKLRQEPPIVRRSMFFPYIAGTRYAGARTPSTLAGSAPKIHSSAPLSTEQVLHPERRDDPIAVFLPDLSTSVGAGRALSYEAVLGEAYLAPALGIQEYERSGLAAGFYRSALSWGGDRLHLYEKPGAAPVVVLMTHWDTPMAALEAYARAASDARVKDGWTAHWNGLQVAVVIGLPPEEGARVAREALGRAVARPFSSPDDLRKLRASPGFPAQPAPVADLTANLDALIADPSFPHISQATHSDGLRAHRKLQYLLQARYNVARKGASLGSFDREAAQIDWSVPELDLLARGAIVPDTSDPQWPKFLTAFDQLGADWPEYAVRRVVDAHSRKSSPDFVAFAKKYENRPAIWKAVESKLFLHQKDPDARAMVLKAAEEGRLKPMAARSYGSGDVPFKTSLYRALIVAAAQEKAKWEDVDTGLFEQGYQEVPSVALPQEVFDRWTALPLSGRGRGYVLAKALLHPTEGARAIPTLRHEVAAPDRIVWDYFPHAFRPVESVKTLPHFKEVLSVLGPFVDSGKGSHELQLLVNFLRR